MVKKNKTLDQDFIKKLEAFDLTEKEEELTSLNEEDVQVGVEECQRSYIGKIFAMKETNLKFIWLAMKKAWKDESLKVIKLKANTYQIFFKNKAEAECIVEQGPWCIDNNLISLKQWSRQKNPEDKASILSNFGCRQWGYQENVTQKKLGERLPEAFEKLKPSKFEKQGRMKETGSSE